jgi:hypothetical protein
MVIAFRRHLPAARRAHYKAAAQQRGLNFVGKCVGRKVHGGSDRFDSSGPTAEDPEVL